MAADHWGITDKAIKNHLDSVSDNLSSGGLSMFEEQGRKDKQKGHQLCAVGHQCAESHDVPQKSGPPEHPHNVFLMSII